MSYEEELKEINFKFKPKQMAALPGVTRQDREVIRYGGTDFYTNEKLRQKFIMSLLKTTPTKAHQTIINLVSDKIIIPAFLTSSTFSYYMKHGTDAEEESNFSGVYGFYSIRDKKIFVLIDAGYKLLGWVPDRHLAAVTLHECMHMVAKKNPTKFMRINIVPLFKYYAKFLELIFEMNGNDKKTITDWIMYIQGFEIKKNELKADVYAKKILKAVKPYTNQTDEQIDVRLTYIVNFTFGTYGTNGSKLVNVIAKYPVIYHKLMMTYQQAFRFKAKTTAYQEMFTVSEVICILASMELANNRYVSDSLDILL
ncbi:MAG: hypothetical protein DRI84_04355 [Bacteroidetes bacterium]|nr:MAG: hypothetical protein DRI84_04355 [Bacteroidota bacterium]